MLRLREADASVVHTWDRVPIRFRVDARVDLDRIERRVAGPVVPTIPVPEPWDKDYDANPAGHPRSWLQIEDLPHWGFLIAERDGLPVGGAVVGLEGPEKRARSRHPDVAILWDIRVAPEVRGTGVGTRLFEGACAWAGARGRKRLLVETQDNNVGANRFYASRGCSLGQVNHGVYADFPDEAQMIWFRALG